MIIRDFEEKDTETIRRIHEQSGLPVNCLPNLADPTFFIKKMAENGNGPLMGGFIRLTGEIFLLVDHRNGTPEQRWRALEKLCADGLFEAWRKGLSHVTAWIPSDIEQSFGKRLIDLGFQKSRWPSYSTVLDDR